MKDMVCALRKVGRKFFKEVKKAIKDLDSFPKGYELTGYVNVLAIHYKENAKNQQIRNFSPF